MSLADELLADFEEGAGVVDDEFGDGDDLDGSADLLDTIEEVTEGDETDEKYDGYERVTGVAKLTLSARYKQVVANLERTELESTDKVESLEQGDYEAVVEANDLTAEIDNEINVIHKFVRDKYSKRFPELESLVPLPLEYMTCVRELGNDIQTKGQNKEILEKLLLPATVIVVSVTASTTQGVSLNESELSAVFEACDMAAELQTTRLAIFRFVEQRMALLAPVLTAVVGASTAALLVGQAGGLRQLARMPACNLLLLGAQRRTLAGFSSAAVLPHAGHVFYSPTVQRLPPDLRRKTARLLAAKGSLAARVDCLASPTNNHTGQLSQAATKLTQQIQEKIEKWLDPPEVKKVKALPKPIDEPSKKRGGRRARKMKERLGMTDLRRKANRMNFGELQEDVVQESMGFTLGQAKGGGGPGKGGVRAAQVDQKSRVRMSKLLQKKVERANQFGGPSGSSSRPAVGHHSSFRGGSSTAGTASSVVFTPVQGLEIVNPLANESKAAADSAGDSSAKYFASTAGFLKVKTPLPGAKMSEKY